MSNNTEAQVVLSGLFRDLAGTAEISVFPGTIQQSLTFIEQKYPVLSGRLVDVKGRPRRYLRISKNGVLLPVLTEATEDVSSGDRITILLAVAGG